MRIQQVLKEYWGFNEFRPLQEDIINSVLKGKDVLALLPTGGGKSICYQVPGMVQEGLCLVISPLIALMKDQVENLRKKNITAFAIYSGMSRKELIKTFEVASVSNCKFLYVSPERLESHLFKEYLPGLHVTLIAVDEAHCISQWGYDFRPSYLKISLLREELPHIPVLALTASATPEVQQDIIDKLEFADHSIFRQSFERKNLSYSVFEAPSKINKIIEVLNNVKGSSIIYCKSRRRTKEISDLLSLQNISADFYHAGLTQEQRTKKQDDWINNRTRVIVCTNAFGMGIDKPDVRTVIHADVPDCLENYYQEAGRGGRDGKNAYGVLLYDQKSLRELEELAQLRFPDLGDIRIVYQALANYLQVPTGQSTNNYYDFDIGDFLKKFKLASHTVFASLKTLEQDGWLSFNEQVFLPATVCFITGKKDLYQFETENPSLEPLIKTLLRAYEGIFDQPVFISEKVVANLMSKDVDDIKKMLSILERAGILNYQPQKDTPQLLFLRNRIPAAELSIDMSAFKKRKEQFLKRMKQMLGYVNEESNCRSKMIGNYFGDAEMGICGICDNCLSEKRKLFTKEDFEKLYDEITSSIENASLPIHELLKKSGSIKREKLLKMLEYLQSEGKIEMDLSGNITVVTKAKQKY